jgi:hypothetical protein
MLPGVAPWLVLSLVYARCAPGVPLARSFLAYARCLQAVALARSAPGRGLMFPGGRPGARSVPGRGLMRSRCCALARSSLAYG